jgi:hypothetical protein
VGTDIRFTITVDELAVNKALKTGLKWENILHFSQKTSFATGSAVIEINKSSRRSVALIRWASLMCATLIGQYESLVRFGLVPVTVSIAVSYRVAFKEQRT